MRRHWFIACLTLLAVLAVVVRLREFGSARPLWIDETIMTHVVSAETWAGTYERARALDYYPPLYVTVLRTVWSFAHHEAALRLPSLLCMLAALALLARVVWRLGGRSAALWLSTVATFASPFVFYAREVRPYGLGMLALAVLLHTWLGLLGNQRSLLPFTGAALAAVATMFQVWPLVACMGLWAFLFGGLGTRHRPVRLLAMAAAIGLAMALLREKFYPTGGPLFRDTFYEQFFPTSSDLLERVSYAARGVLQLAAYVLIGETPGPRWRVAGEVGGALLLTASLSGVWQSRRRNPAASALHGVTWISILVFAVFGVAWLHPFGGSRHCLPLAALLLVSGALGLGDLMRTPARIPALLSAAGLVVLALGATLRVPTPPWYRTDFPGLLGQLRSVDQPPRHLAAIDVVCHGLHFYSRPSDPWFDGLAAVPRTGPDIRRALDHARTTPAGSQAIAWQAPDDVFIAPYLETFQHQGGRFRVLEDDGVRVAILNPAAAEPPPASNRNP